MARFDLQTRQYIDHYNFAAGPLKLKGDPLSHDPAVQAHIHKVEIDFAAATSAHEFYLLPNAQNVWWGELLGKDVNHSTVPWWAYQRAIDALS